MHDMYVLDQGAAVPILLKLNFSPVQVCHPGRAMMAASDYGVNIAAAAPVWSFRQRLLDDGARC